MSAKNSLSKTNPETLANDVFLPALHSAISQAARQTEDGTMVVNAFVNAFAMVLADLMQGAQPAAALLEGLAQHMKTTADQQPNVKPD